MTQKEYNKMVERYGEDSAELWEKIEAQEKQAKFEAMINAPTRAEVERDISLRYGEDSLRIMKEAEAKEKEYNQMIDEAAKKMYRSDLVESILDAIGNSSAQERYDRLKVNFKKRLNDLCQELDYAVQRHHMESISEDFGQLSLMIMIEGLKERYPAQFAEAGK